MKELSKIIREKTIERLDNLEMLLVRYETEHPVIAKLLNLPKQALYELTRCHKYDLNSVEGLIHSLRHAFVDDGDWSIVRRLDTDMEEFYVRMNIPEDERDRSYRYEIEMGDWTLSEGVQAILIHEEDWNTIIDTHMLHINFYENSAEKIDNDEEGYNDKYWELKWMSDELYARWFDERKDYWS